MNEMKVYKRTIISGIYFPSPFIDLPVEPRPMWELSTHVAGHWKVLVLNGIEIRNGSPERMLEFQEVK